MKHTLIIGIFIIALPFSSCLRDKGKDARLGDETSSEVSSNQAAGGTGEETETKLETRHGFLAEEVSQHPVLTLPLGIADDLTEDVPELEGESQFYFDVGDREEPEGQIIVIHPGGMKIPTEPGRKIELTGVSEPVDLGGEEGTKSFYKGETFHLKNWRYID